MSNLPIVIAGPTGTGKSDLGMRLAESIGGEIVNYDSVQIYRGFDIGSAKPSIETRSRVPHHLFDIVDAEQEFNAASYATLARATCQEIAARGRRAILVGGTFFYLRALLHGLPQMPGRDDRIRQRLRRIADRPRGSERLHRWLSTVDPQSGKKIALADRHRVERALEVWLISGRPISERERPGSSPAKEEMRSTKIGLRMERSLLIERLDARVAAMYEAGIIEETRILLGRYSRNARPFGAIGYAEAAAVVMGEMDPVAAIEETQRRTRAYAKRQMTWFRSERNVQWIDVTLNEDPFGAAMPLLELSEGSD